MNLVICHQCGEKFPRNKVSLARIWVGVIKAEKAERLMCFECLAERRREAEEHQSWEREGESWRPDYNPDNPNGEEWKKSS
jgi:hypothetical protein